MATTRAEISIQDMLGGIVGEQLSAVTFVQDYWQLDFDGHVLTVWTRLAVGMNTSEAQSGDDQFRNRLCEQIAKIVQRVSVTPCQTLTITFTDGSMIEVSLRDEDHIGPETMMYKAPTQPDLLVVRPSDAR